MLHNISRRVCCKCSQHDFACMLCINTVSVCDSNFLSDCMQMMHLQQDEPQRLFQLQCQWLLDTLASPFFLSAKVFYLLSLIVLHSRRMALSQFYTILCTCKMTGPRLAPCLSEQFLNLLPLIPTTCTVLTSKDATI